MPSATLEDGFLTTALSRFGIYALVAVPEATPSDPEIVPGPCGMEPCADAGAPPVMEPTPPETPPQGAWKNDSVRMPTQRASVRELGKPKSNANTPAPTAEQTADPRARGRGVGSGCAADCSIASKRAERGAAVLPILVALGFLARLGRRRS